jgi:hypothetical protein
MNREEIDQMMRGLPSQQPQETTWSKLWIGTWFIMFLILCAYAPDIRYQPTEEINHGNCQKDTSQESGGKSPRKEGTREGHQKPRYALQT